MSKREEYSRLADDVIISLAMVGDMSDMTEETIFGYMKGVLTTYLESVEDIDEFGYVTEATLEKSRNDSDRWLFEVLSKQVISKGV